jgi:hypothetical protein
MRAWRVANKVDEKDDDVAARPAIGAEAPVTTAPTVATAPTGLIILASFAVAALAAIASLSARAALPSVSTTTPGAVNIQATKEVVDHDLNRATVLSRCPVEAVDPVEAGGTVLARVGCVVAPSTAVCIGSVIAWCDLRLAWWTGGNAVLTSAVDVHKPTSRQAPRAEPGRRTR